MGEVTTIANSRDTLSGFHSGFKGNEFRLPQEKETHLGVTRSFNERCCISEELAKMVGLLSATQQAVLPVPLQLTAPKVSYPSSQGVSLLQHQGEQVPRI